METPLNQFGKTSSQYEQDVAYGKFSGFVSHYHVSKRKIDCAGLDIKTLLGEIESDVQSGYKSVSDSCEDEV